MSLPTAGPGVRGRGVHPCETVGLRSAVRYVACLVLRREALGLGQRDGQRVEQRGIHGLHRVA